MRCFLIDYYLGVAYSSSNLNKKEAYMSEDKKKLFNLKLTDEQKEKLRKLAKKEGLTMTGYIVDHIRRTETQA